MAAINAAYAELTGGAGSSRSGGASTAARPAGARPTGARPAAPARPPLPPRPTNPPAAPRRPPPTIGPSAHPVRWLAYCGVALVGFVVFAVVVAATAGGGSSSKDRVGWTKGSCVQSTDQLHAVPCSLPHSGRIIAVTDGPDACSTYTDLFVVRAGHGLCIDTDV